MQSIEERERTGLKLCHACNFEVRNLTDKFCRRCGARQIHDTERLYNDPPDPSITPHMDPVAETGSHSLSQNATGYVAFEKMRRRIFSLLGTEY
jgi:hypothetical protein